MRSLLFVPADGGPKLDKALASGADAVIVDLEDSIVPERKPAAREAALAFLDERDLSSELPVFRDLTARLDALRQESFASVFPELGELMTP